MTLPEIEQLALEALGSWPPEEDGLLFKQTVGEWLLSSRRADESNALIYDYCLPILTITVAKALAHPINYDFWDAVGYLQLSLPAILRRYDPAKGKLYTHVLIGVRHRLKDFLGAYIKGLTDPLNEALVAWDYEGERLPTPPDPDEEAEALRQSLCEYIGQLATVADELGSLLHQGGWGMSPSKVRAQLSCRLGYPPKVIRTCYEAIISGYPRPKASRKRRQEGHQA